MVDNEGLSTTQTQKSASEVCRVSNSQSPRGELEYLTVRLMALPLSWDTLRSVFLTSWLTDVTKLCGVQEVDHLLKFFLGDLRDLELGRLPQNSKWP